LARRERVERHTAVLIVSAVLFLAGAKWFLAVRGRPTPSLSRIQACKEAPGVRRRWRLWRRARAGRNGQAAIPQIDLAFVDRVVEEEGRGAEAAIPILQRIQSRFRYLPDEALRRVCELTDISPSQIAGVSTFYAQFRRSPVGRHIIKVCHGTACHVSGATEIAEELRRRLKIAPDSDTDPERMFTIDEVACLGCCSLAPVIMIEETTAGKLTPATACGAVEAFRAEYGE
jgi:NADH:ubiquinone oxidoreductase subunit E